MKAHLFLLALLFCSSTYALELKDQVELSNCFENNCSNVWLQRGMLEGDIKYIAYFDVVDIDKDGTPTFLPLFNIYNTTNKAITFNLTMELLDQKMEALVTVKQQVIYQPQNGRDDQASFRSLNGVDINPEFRDKVKHVRVNIERQ